MTKLAQQKVASLLIRGSEKTLDVVAVDREDDIDLVVSIPKERPGVLGLRIETASRLSIGPFGKWLVIDERAPQLPPEGECQGVLRRTDVRRPVRPILSAAEPLETVSHIHWCGLFQSS